MSSWGNGSYTYDNLNNISEYKLGDNVSENYAYNTTTNQLNSVAGTANKTFAYDANGNITSNGQDTFIYNAANQLIKVTGTNNSGQAIEIDYVFDAANHVVSYTETVAGVKKQPVFTIYDDSGDLLYSIDPNKNKTKDYIYLAGKQVAIAKHTTGDTAALDTTYYVNDALGSPAASIDNTGALSWHRHYQPYGKEIDNKDPEVNHTSFTGKKLYGDIGLVHMNARFYDPVVGRFMGYDPAAVTPDNLFSFNRYAYANNNPMLYTDPNGLLPDLPEAIAGAAIGFVSGAFMAGWKGAFVGAAAGLAASVGTSVLAAPAAITSAVEGMSVATTVSTTTLNVAAGVTANAAEQGFQGASSWSGFSMSNFNSALSPSNISSTFDATVVGNIGKIGVGMLGKAVSGYSTSYSLAGDYALNTSYNSKGDSISSDAVKGIASLTDKTINAANNAANSNAARQVGAMEGAKSQAAGMGAAASHSSGNSGGNGANAGGDTHSGGGWF